ncbi:outer membrane beta-barrel protein [Aestuariibaculum suncheonense]|uniref:PorT family protein n=1 Tax=Aestuariibaculum suncheonense TaxID=1028745 RepID=A0A8J6Q6T2_9FLAO|nr:outer membrane beta-barrel protein [Aestuariibaculum suncheonense]MBD0835279.1 PorT family protein [Aestuariibaculum suncheonense]
MKKYVPQFLIVFMLLLSNKAPAQILLGLIFGDDLNSEKLIFGVHLNYSWNDLSNLPESGSLNAFNLGLNFNYKISDKFRAQTEMLAKYTRGAGDIPVYSLGDEHLDALYANGKVSREIKYLSIPIAIQYLTPIGVYAEAGPHVSMRIKANDVFEADTPEGNLELKRNIKDMVNLWDFGWIVGIGYYIAPLKTTSVGLRYYGGFSDVIDVSGRQVHQQWAVYANIPLGRKGKDKQD